MGDIGASELRAKGARFLIVAASAVVLIAGLRAASTIIVPFLIALFLSLISLPLLAWLQRHRVPRWLAVVITVLVALLALGAIAVLIGGSIREFTAEVPKYQRRLETTSASLLALLEERGVRVDRQMLDDLVDPTDAMNLLTTTLRGVAAVLSNLLLVLLTIVFILSEAVGFPDKLRAAFGPSQSSERFARVRREVQRYLGIKTLVSLATGGLVAGAMAVVGVDFPLLWGALAFLLNYIPALGSILAAIPPALLAAIQLGFGHAAAVIAVFLTVNVVLGSFVEPHLMGRRLGLSTLVVFVSLVFWGWVWGPVGMLLSVPLTMVLKIMLENTEDLRWVAVLLDAGPHGVPERESE